MNKNEFDSIKQLASSHQQLAKQAVNALKTEVDALINEENNDFMQIERLLDYLLDVACIPEGLTEFKKLCRYYYELLVAKAIEFQKTLSIRVFTKT